MSKAEAQAIHTKRRAAERYGVDLNEHDLGNMKNQIQRGQATFVERQSNRVTKWIVKLPRTGEAVLAIYDNKRGAIVTVLPREALKRKIDQTLTPLLRDLTS